MKTNFPTTKTEAADVLDRHWDEESEDKNELYDSAIKAMIEFSEESVENAECDEDHTEDASFDDFLEMFADYTMDDLTQKQIDGVRGFLNLGVSTVAEELKEEIWYAARDKYSIAELEERLK